MIDIIIAQLLAIFGALGYKNVFILMVVESSFIPFPSELIIIPTAYLASQGHLNIYLIVFLGVLASIIGALINYFLAYYLGRAIIYNLAKKRFFKFLLIDENKIKTAEDFFLKYGEMSTFFGRLIPVVRQLISIPAGFSKMDLRKFCIWTGIGAGLWISFLAGVGYFFGQNKEILYDFIDKIGNIMIIVSVFSVASILVFYWKKRRVSHQ